MQARGFLLPHSLPWMPVLIDDWETSETIRQLDYQGEGIYFALLRHQWRHGSIPRQEADIRKVLRLPLGQFPALMSLIQTAFKIQKTRRVNRKLALLRSKALDKCAENKKIAVVRWHNERIAKAVRPQSVGTATASQSQSHIQSHITTKTTTKAFPEKRNGRVMPKTYDYTPGVKGPAL